MIGIGSGIPRSPDSAKPLRRMNQVDVSLVGRQGSCEASTWSRHREEVTVAAVITT